MLIVALQQIGWKDLIKLQNKESQQIVLALLVAPLGLFLFMNYLYYLVGDALAFSHIQIAWGKTFSNPFTTLINAFGNRSSFYLATVTLFALLISLLLLYKKRYAEFAILLISILIPLSTGILSSMARYIYCLFPIYIALAILTHRINILKFIILVFFSSGLAFMSTSWILSKGFMI